jgi:hypothetical protein
MVLLRSGALEDDLGVDGWEPIPLAARVRVLAAAALGPLVTGYAAVAAIFALVTSVASRAQFTTTGVLTTAMPGWLAVHQVPVRVEGHVLGVLPLLPTLAAVVLIARTAAGAAQRLELETPREAAQVVAAIAGAHAVFGLTLGLLCAGRPATVDPLAAFYYPALLAAMAAIAGVARRGGLLAVLLDRVDGVALRGLRVGVLATVALLAAGALTLSLGLVASLPAVRELFARNASGPGSGLGLLLLCAGYVPNAVIAATSFVAGPGFALGEISLTSLTFRGGPVPGLPLLAALPERTAVWWPVLLVLPVGVGVLVGRRLRYAAEEPRDRLRAVAVATAVVALSLVVLAGSAGGPAGGGRFDPVDLRAASLSVALVAWVGVTGAAVAWFGGPRPQPDGPAGLIDDEDEPFDDADDDEDDEFEDDADDAAETPDDAEEPAAGDEDLAAEID